MHERDRRIIVDKLHAVDADMCSAQRAGDKEIVWEKTGEYQGIAWMLALMGYSPKKVNGLYQLRPLGSPE